MEHRAEGRRLRRAPVWVPRVVGMLPAGAQSVAEMLPFGWEFPVWSCCVSVKLLSGEKLPAGACCLVGDSHSGFLGGEAPSLGFVVWWRLSQLGFVVCQSSRDLLGGSQMRFVA